MIVRCVEIRDAGTFIPAMAIRLEPENEAQRYLMRRVGFAVPGAGIVVMRLNDQMASSDPYTWYTRTGGTRTMQVAHEWIEKHFDEMVDGAVVDVEFILGETAAPKRSDREYDPT